MGRVIEDGDELGLPWDDWADGRVHRLRKGVHFTRSSAAVQEAAQNAALRLGRAVRTVKEVRDDLIFVWVQFGDHELEPGESCPCGGDDLRHVNQSCAVCGVCGATLMFAKSKRRVLYEEAPGEAPAPDDVLLDLSRLVFEFDEGPAEAGRREPFGADGATDEKREAERARRERRAAVAEARRAAQERRLQRAETKGVRAAGAPITRLEAFRDVRLFRYDRVERRERYYGYGFDDYGQPLLLFVRFPLRDGKWIADTTQPGTYVHAVRSLPATPFARVLDFERLNEQAPDLTGDEVRAPRMDDAAEAETSQPDPAA